MSDVVAKLLNRIEEIEKVAKAATFDPYKIHVDNPEDGPHIRWHDPESVLRLCRAHRDIIEMWREAVAEEVRRREEGQIGERQRHATGRSQGLLRAVKALARGLGVEETEDNDGR